MPNIGYLIILVCPSMKKIGFGKLDFRAAELGKLHK